MAIHVIGWVSEAAVIVIGVGAIWGICHAMWHWPTKG